MFSIFWTWSFVVAQKTENNFTYFSFKIIHFYISGDFDCQKERQDEQEAGLASFEAKETIRSSTSAGSILIRG